MGAQPLAARARTPRLRAVPPARPCAGAPSTHDRARAHRRVEPRTAARTRLRSARCSRGDGAAGARLLRVGPVSDRARTRRFCARVRSPGCRPSNCNRHRARAGSCRRAYGAAFFSSLRDLRANLAPVASLSIGLVIGTTGGRRVGRAHRDRRHDVAGPLSRSARCWRRPIRRARPRSPGDSGAPKRFVTVVEGESLINDATALIAFKFAVAATVGVGSRDGCRRRVRAQLGRWGGGGRRRGLARRQSPSPDRRPAHRDHDLPLTPFSPTCPRRCLGRAVSLRP